MKKIIFLLLFIYSNAHSSEFKLEKVYSGLNKPWSLSFIDKENIILTEKSGKLFALNLKSKNINEIKHNLSINNLGQGGLLDVLYYNKDIYISYSENRGNWNSSTSVARGKFGKYTIKFKNIFRADPPIESGYHFGSRLVIKNKKLYVTVGERGQGMIAQDASKHPGSIIRINLDGSAPKDNPKFPAIVHAITVIAGAMIRAIILWLIEFTHLKPNIV